MALSRLRPDAAATCATGNAAHTAAPVLNPPEPEEAPLGAAAFVVVPGTAFVVDEAPPAGAAEDVVGREDPVDVTLAALESLPPQPESTIAVDAPKTDRRRSRREEGEVFLDIRFL